MTRLSRLLYRPVTVANWAGNGQTRKVWFNNQVAVSCEKHRDTVKLDHDQLESQGPVLTC
jgi:hypothetical protein